MTPDDIERMAAEKVAELNEEIRRLSAELWKWERIARKTRGRAAYAYRNRRNLGATDKVKRFCAGEWRSLAEIRKVTGIDSASVSLVYRLHRRGVLGRRGTRGSYEFRLAEPPETGGEG